MTPTKDTSLPEWSSDELKSLLNQALALEFVKLKRKEEERPKSSWFGILQSIAPTIVTVLLGTIFGSYLASRIQETSRRNEARHTAQQSNLAEEQKTIDSAFSVIGKTASASQDVIDMTGEGFDENAPGLAPEMRRDLVAQKHAIWQTYNAATATWRGERERMGMLLAIRYERPEEISSSWQKLSGAVDKFSDCALKYNKQNYEVVPHDKLQSACENQRKLLNQSLAKLSELIVKARMDLEPRGSH